jgi:hypothetical protein
VDQGLAVWRPRASDGILFRGGWHDVTLLGASRLSGNGRRGNYGLSDLLDERISRFGAPTAHAENIAFPVSPAPRARAFSFSWTPDFWIKWPSS